MSLFSIVSVHRSETIHSRTQRVVETFEGLGVGSRLAYMELPHRYSWVPVLGAVIYGITTPIGTSIRPHLLKATFLTCWTRTGIAAGLGIRSTYNPGSTTASIVSGILDSFSAGILIYTGLVEVSTTRPSVRVSVLITPFSCSRTSSSSTRK